METAIKFFVPIAVTAALVLSFMAYNKKAEVVTVVNSSGEKVGSVVGPDSYLPYLANNDVKTFSYSSKLNQASTTVCSFRTPSATSTLVYGAVNITTGSTTATIWEMGKDVGAAGTSTLVGGRFTLAANALATFLATTSVNVANANQAFVYGPNQFFTVKFGGSSTDVNVFVGSCKAVFISAQ